MKTSILETLNWINTTKKKTTCFHSLTKRQENWKKGKKYPFQNPTNTTKTTSKIIYLKIQHFNTSYY